MILHIGKNSYGKHSCMKRLSGHSLVLDELPGTFNIVNFSKLRCDTQLEFDQQLLLVPGRHASQASFLGLIITGVAENFDRIVGKLDILGFIQIIVADDAFETLGLCDYAFLPAVVIPVGANLRTDQSVNVDSRSAIIRRGPLALLLNPTLLLPLFLARSILLVVLVQVHFLRHPPILCERFASPDAIQRLVLSVALLQRFESSLRLQQRRWCPLLEVLRLFTKRGGLNVFLPKAEMRFPRPATQYVRRFFATLLHELLELWHFLPRRDIVRYIDPERLRPPWVLHTDL
mmetsp:Transcript_30051/g.49754  ORF Transcript_30051/g.49754 Transcript_30051/m.49754 type:complete len:289 (+) Transcript_30051:383-1249(+)